MGKTLDKLLTVSLVVMGAIVLISLAFPKKQNNTNHQAQKNPVGTTYRVICYSEANDAIIYNKVEDRKPVYTDCVVIIDQSNKRNWQ